MSVPMIHNLISRMNCMNDDMVAYPFEHDFAAPAVPSAHHRSLVRHADHPEKKKRQNRWSHIEEFTHQMHQIQK